MIQAPDSTEMDHFCDQLAEFSAKMDSESWPSKQLELCAKYGVFRWFLAPEWGGYGWSPIDITRGYLRLAQSCLTTTFVVTQRSGACRRIAGGTSSALKESLLPGLAAGETFATVGISHLTTSGQHLGKPLLRAEKTDQGFVLNGFSPWVTGAAKADLIVMGATLDSDEQLMAAISTQTRGVDIPLPPRFVGLTGSLTGKVVCEDVVITEKDLIAGPEFDVMKSGTGANTGGHQTSTLALGLSQSAIQYLRVESEKRPELQKIADELQQQWESASSILFGVAQGDQSCSNDELRTRANSLVLRSTQAALMAAKGTGYLDRHPVGRWCREALFFLVWSCPQGVADANLCELAGIHADETP